MSKGNRARKGRDEYEAKKTQREETRIHERKKVNKKVALITIVSLLLIAVIVAGAIGIDYFRDNGYLNRSKIVLKTEHMEITVPMMQYYFYSVVYNNVDYYVKNHGLDNTKPLREQKVLGTNETWFEFLMDGYLEEAKVMISYAEEAVVKGIQLTQKDMEKVEREIKLLEDKAKEEGQSFTEYVRKQYGAGLIKQDIKDAIELKTLAYKRVNQINAGFEFTDEEIDERFGHRKDVYLSCDYKKYTFETEADERTEQELAEELSQVDTPEAFDVWLVLYHSNKLGVEDPGDLPKEQADVINKKVENAYYKNQKFDYLDESGFTDWAFKDALTENARKPGESWVTPGEKEGSYTVYYMVKSPYRDEGETRNIRYIFFDPKVYGDKTQANNFAKDVYANWQKEQNKTEEVFKEYEILYNDYNFSISRNVKKDQYTKNFDDWMFNHARKAGDTTLIQEAEGTYIVYYMGQGEPAWKADLINELIEVKMEELNQTKPEEYEITINEKHLDRIP